MKTHTKNTTKRTRSRYNLWEYRHEWYIA